MLSKNLDLGWLQALRQELESISKPRTGSDKKNLRELDPDQSKNII